MTRSENVHKALRIKAVIKEQKALTKAIQAKAIRLANREKQLRWKIQEMNEQQPELDTVDLDNHKSSTSTMIISQRNQSKCFKLYYYQ